MLSSIEFRAVQKAKQLKFYISSFEELNNIRDELECSIDTNESVLEVIRKALMLISNAIDFRRDDLTDKALYSFKRAEQTVNEIGISF